MGEEVGEKRMGGEVGGKVGGEVEEGEGRELEEQLKALSKEIEIVYSLPTACLILQ